MTDKPVSDKPVTDKPATDRSDIARPSTDDTQGVAGNRDGTGGGMFGNEYDSHRAEQPGTVAVGVDDGGTAADPAGPGDGVGIPAEAGRRAHVDQRTGAVHGSGMGAGGGEGGEDFDADAAGGSGEE